MSRRPLSPLLVRTAAALAGLTAIAGSVPAASQAQVEVPAVRLEATMSSAQEVPPKTHPGTATAVVHYLERVDQFDIEIAASDFPPAQIDGFRLFFGAAGTNGPFLLDLMPGGTPIAPFTPAGTGFAFVARRVGFVPARLAELGMTQAEVREHMLAGRTYLSFRTAAFPQGAIRGQLRRPGTVDPTPPPPTRPPTPPPAPPPPGTPPADETPPVVSRVSMTNRRFRVGAKPTPIRAGTRRRSAPVGTAFRFTLSEQARPEIKLKRVIPGRRLRRGGRCVANGRRGARCSVLRRAGILVRDLGAGRQAVAFSGRVGRAKLRAGAYQATITARDAEGNLSDARQVRFTVVS